MPSNLQFHNPLVRCCQAGEVSVNMQLMLYVKSQTAAEKKLMKIITTSEEFVFDAWDQQYY